MSAVRPHFSVPLALATLALALASWWAVDTFRGSGVAPEEHETSLLPTFPDQPPIEDDAAARSAGAQPPAKPPRRKTGEGAEDTSPPEGAEAPPRRIVPRTLGAEDTDAVARDADDAAADEDDQDGREAPPVGSQAAGSGFDLIGGVARPSARATEAVEVPAGRARIGTPLRWVNGLAASGAGGIYRALLMEAPLHTVRVERFFIDRFEVSNHRYWRYLQSAARLTYDTSDHQARTLADIARALVASPPVNLDFENVTARQLYEANAAALHAGLPGAVVSRADGSLDREATWARLRERIVPAGLQLDFYDHAPPGTWPSDRYVETGVDHPVRDLSLEEAIDFASWAGRHVPTEIEWEYAARGPHGLDFPWGPQGRDFSERVNGGREPGPDAFVETVPITQFADGASWIGCFQMLGNVSEWTCSWLDPYPGGPSAASLAAVSNVVVRGGSADDRSRYGLRPAFRGWVGGDPDGGPRPRWRLRWTGFRTARYEAVGRSRLPSMHHLARAGGALSPDAFEPRVYAAWQGMLLRTQRRVFRGPETEIGSGIKAFVLQPFRTLLTRDPATGTYRPDRDHGLATAPALLAESTGGQPVLLGLLHTDLPLVDLWQGQEDGAGALRPPGRLGRADCPPGTWLLGVVNEQLALIRPDLQAAYYLTTRGLPQALLNVLPDRTGRPVEHGEVELRLNGRSGRLEAELLVPLGGREALGARVLVRLRLQAQPRDLAFVARWAPGSER